MWATGNHVTGSTAAADAARDWQAVRGAGTIQYSPLPPVKPPEPPGWLQALGRLLEKLFRPIGEWLGLSWPVLEKILIALAVALILFVLWRLLLAPMIDARRNRRAAEPDPEWAPGEAEALALLEDADRLAAEGRFDEATHLLLRRSVAQIRAARPDWLAPASTAREIASLPVLPPAGARAFSMIADRVERSLFALRQLDAKDWEQARSAYASFAQVELAA